MHTTARCETRRMRQTTTAHEKSAAQCTVGTAMMRSKKIIAAFSVCFILACCYGVHLLSSNTVFHCERPGNSLTCQAYVDRYDRGNVFVHHSVAIIGCSNDL